MYDDTIAAIATPLGEGGLGVIRLSGKDAKRLAERLFGKSLRDRRLVHGYITDPLTGERVDEVMVAYMAAPRSYTREDVVEISCHGGPMPLQRILELTLREGARLANPGEFTLRAFLNGRIDLAQGEAVLDIVRARTESGLRLAVQGLGGRLSQPIKEARAKIMGVLAYLTARIDFPEDEVEEQETEAPLREARQEIQELIASADTGMIYRQGVRTAIVGKPNAGKSSLLNRLLGENRAIVTPIPGTTRDTLEEVMSIQGIPFVLVDTAGITKSKDLVEQLGIERSRQAIQQADLVLMVLDLSCPLEEKDQEIISLLSGKEVLLVANKRDLPQKADLKGLSWEPMYISALTGAGMVELQDGMAQVVLKGKAVAGDAVMVTNPRHKAALEKAERHLASALDGLTAELADDFITIDLTAALNALGEITGETVTEELLDTIFSRFCIGK